MCQLCGKEKWVRALSREVGTQTPLFIGVTWTIYSLESEEKPLKPDPGQEENNNSGREGQQKPGAEVDAATIRVAPVWRCGEAFMARAWVGSLPGSPCTGGVGARKSVQSRGSHRCCARPRHGRGRRVRPAGH